MNKYCRYFTLIFTLFGPIWPTLAYKPVFIVHGVLSGNITMIPMVERIKEKHPGTIVYASDKYSGWSSLHPMWRQVEDIGSDLNELMKAHPEGVHLLGYSQGGLIARGIIENNPQHNIHNFISLSSPQAGQYGTQFLHLFFPSLACEEAYELFYSVIGQHTSIGNYWNDPHHQALFLEYSAYLPYINNLLVTNNTLQFKESLVKLKNMVLIGGPDDEVITPWQSSQFGYFNDNETVVLMRDQGFYKNDSFGIRTLDKAGKLKIVELSGNTHLQWHINMTVIDNYILPYLD